MNVTQFIPNTFNVPLSAQSTFFKLQPLTIQHAVKDYDAVMSNREYLWQRFGDIWGWPTSDLSLEQDMIDLAWHQKEFQLRSTFAYAVLSLDGMQVLGCVYIYPPQFVGTDAQVWHWVRQRDAEPDLESDLCMFLTDWLFKHWPFKIVLLNNVVCNLGE